jgi:UDP-GlcNAc:undecaprenyl-phosphate GlcNAc-1-phosphate transferase
MWRYFSPGDIGVYVRAVATAIAASMIALLLVYRFEGFSRTVFIIDAMALALLLVGSRASFRIIGELGSRYRSIERHAIIYGAGDGGTLLVRELRNNPKYGFLPSAFIDDDERKWKRRLLGLPVLGGYDTLEELLVRNPPAVLIISTGHLDPARFEQLRMLSSATGVMLLSLDFRLTQLTPSDSVSLPLR